MVAALPTLCNNLRTMEISTLDFVYLDSDPRTMRPSACVYVKTVGGGDFAGINAGNLIGRPCLSFIELDAEIRRLHADSTKSVHGQRRSSIGRMPQARVRSGYGS